MPFIQSQVNEKQTALQNVVFFFSQYSTSVLLHLLLIENIIVCGPLAALPETNNCTFHINRVNIQSRMFAACISTPSRCQREEIFPNAQHKDPRESVRIGK